MVCAACGQETATDPCGACGAAPLLEARYRLERVLGRGTTGTTFAAVRLADGVAVAVKEMPLRQADTAKARELIGREVRVLRQLHHPQIPAWLDDFVVGVGKHASLYLVLELVDGLDLAGEMERHRYDEREALDVLIGLLPVLVYLHNVSPPVIHRDIKPRNVVRRAGSGELVLLDFGAVRDAVVDAELGGSTVAGTFGYMAPEQFRGDAGPASDIYALGALAVALLTRREPHTLADANGILAWAQYARVSPPVARLVGRMLDRDARRRPSDAAALLVEVRTLREELDRPRPAPPAPPAPPPSAPPPPPGAPRAPDSPAARPTPVKVATADRLFEPSAPFEPPVLRRSSPPARRGGGPLAGLTLAGCMALFGAVTLLAVGAWALTSVLSRDTPVAVEVTFPAPTLAAPACAVVPRAPALDVPASTSRYQFIGASEDGSRAALALGRQADQRAEVIVYEAGSREHVAERILAPASVPGDWPQLLQKLVDDNAGLLARSGLRADLAPQPVAWCQSGDAVQIGDETWSFRTFTESCDLGFGDNTSYELCPPGAADASQCVVPPRLRIGCWDDKPELVDVFQQGDAVWVVAERPHGSTTPRFAAGVMHPKPK